MTTAKNRWLEEGLTVLAEEGRQGIRIDRIAARLGLSKGSFHHHFDGIADYQSALLGHYETRTLGLLAGAMAGGEAASDILSALPAQADELFEPRLEVAVRAWALQDEVARRVQERVDTARLASLERLWRSLTDDPERARTAALLPHLLTIGASVAQPPVTGDELQRVYELLAELIPAVADDRPDPT